MPEDLGPEETRRSACPPPLDYARRPSPRRVDISLAPLAFTTIAPFVLVALGIEAKPLSTWATLGYLSPFPAALGVFLAFRALRRIRRDPDAFGGMRTAQVAIGFGILMILFTGSIGVPSLYFQEKGARTARTLVNLRRVYNGLQQYEATYDAYPDDLLALVATGNAGTQDLLDLTSRRICQACAFYYFAGLSRNDPRDWVVAYGEPPAGGREKSLVLFADGSVRACTEPSFSTVLDHFKREFETARGRPPVLVPPR